MNPADKKGDTKWHHRKGGTQWHRRKGWPLMTGKKLKTLIIIIVAAIVVAAIIVFLSTGNNSGEETYHDADQLTGKSVAAISGAATGSMLDSYYGGNVNIMYYNSNADMAAALSAGKVDAYIADVYAARLMCASYPSQSVLEDTPIKVNQAGFFFKKDDAEGTRLCNQMNEMLAQLSESGDLYELEQKWSASESPTLDIALSGENGTIKYACCSSIGRPFCFIQDGQVVGYEVELAYLFCEKYGYSIEIIDSDYGGMLPSVEAGKADFGGTCTSITPERQKQCLFSDPSLSISFNLVVNGLGDQYEETTIIDTTVASFYNTFITENRWKLFVSGIGVTLLITVSAIILGTLLGLGVFFLCYDGKAAANKITDFCIWLIHGMPVVVFLMIFYYILFGNSDLSGTVISIIVFTLIFASSFFNMLRSSYKAIDKGQMEAAVSLGYTPFAALTKRILPQMLYHFKPAYEEAIVSLIKATAIVGYIAEQDLTKVSDIVRGLTYEAFFPLVATAVLYFLLAGILKTIVRLIFRGMDSRRRTPEQILKGIHQ